MRRIKKIVLLCIAFLLVFYVNASAENQITCEYDINGRDVVIFGQVQGVDKPCEVTLTIIGPDDYISINQVTSDQYGNYTFYSEFSPELPYGEYSLRVGSDTTLPVYSGTIKYERPTTTTTEKFIDVNLDVSIKSYTPSIIGTVTVPKGKNISLEIHNKTDGTTSNDAFVGSDSESFAVEYYLPKLSKGKTTEVTFVCKDGTRTMMNVTLLLETTNYTVTLTCNTVMDNNIRLVGNLKSNPISIIDKTITVSGNKTVDGTIPNIISTCSFDLTAQGYETVTTGGGVYNPPSNGSYCIKNGKANEEFTVNVSASNVDVLENKRYIVTYNPDQIEAVDLYVQSPNKILGVGRIRNIEITEFTPGRVVFKMFALELDEEKTWSGLVNILKFKFKPIFSGSTKISIECTEENNE